MNSREVDFLRRLLTDSPEYRILGAAAESLAAYEHIGTVHGKRVYYGTRDFERATNLLRSRGIAIDVPTEPYTRSQAPSGLSEKRGAQPVSEGLIAVRGLHMPELMAPQRGFVAAQTSDVLGWNYQVLLVVENLEALMRLDDYLWLERFVQGRRTLAIFRGALGWFKTDAAAALINADHRPTLAFFDFDPKGLAMAASLPRREALCLPDLPALEAAVLKEARRNLYSQSADTSAAQLSREANSQIQAAWELLQRLAMGLDQEHFPARPEV